MQPADSKMLEYLHDATVLTVLYDAEDRKGRALTLHVKCDPDAGYAEWDGKRLSVRLESIVLLSFFVFGAVARKEQINSWGTKVSALMESEIVRLQASGYNCEGQRFIVAFHSGSILEGLCQRIHVEEGQT
jgi:hypothetical protein